jgi:hypothetical protein
VVGGFYGVLIGSKEFLALKWMTLKKGPRGGAVRRWLYLVANALRVGPAKSCLVLSLQ